MNEPTLMTPAEKKAFLKGHNVGWFGSIALGRELGYRGNNLSKMDDPPPLSWRGRRFRRRLDKKLERAHARGWVRYDRAVMWKGP